MNKVALLVIDIQRGAFDGERCPLIDRAESFVESALALVDAARAGGAHVVFVQHCDSSTGEVFEEHSPHWELHEGFAPRPGDTVLQKYASSAFDGTDLERSLSKVDAKELVLCGLQSEFCISNTAKSALAMGYVVHIARDAHRTWPFSGLSAEAISERVNDELEARGAVVAATDDLVRVLRESSLGPGLAEAHR